MLMLKEEMTLKQAKILVVGSFVMDLIVSTPKFPQSGETMIGLTYSTAPGGKGANQAVQAARLGAKVTMVGKVGKDAFGDALLASAQAAGVDVSHVAKSDVFPSAVGNVQLEMAEGKSANRIIVVSGANMDITVDDVAFLEEAIDQFDLVMLQLEIPMEINCLVAKWAKARGIPVMLNSAPMASIPSELLQCLSFISPNEHEARLLTGLPVDSEDDIAAIMNSIHQMGVENVLITLGERGVAYSGVDGNVVYSPALKGLDVRDTTAAGDSFVGAFCTAICQGLEIKESLVFANHAAAITVSRPGAQPSLPTIDEVLALMVERHQDTENIETAWSRKMNGFDTFKTTATQELNSYISGMQEEDFLPAAELIWEVEKNGNRLHVTGIGKPSHVANYVASLISSTGTPTYFLHGTEAVHGSCGQLMPGDVVICISNSGETAELKATAMAIRNNGCKIIAVTGNRESWLAKYADAHLLAHVNNEGGPLNRAPRTSILCETFALQMLSVILQEKKHLTPQEYVKRHPGGTLGQLRENEKES